MARLGLIWGGGAVILHRGFPGSSVVKNPPAMQEPQETYAQSLSQEDHLEEERATHSSILAWRIPWREEPGGLQSMGSQSQTRLSKYTHIHTLHRQRRIYSLGVTKCVLVLLFMRFIAIYHHYIDSLLLS